MTTVAWDGTTLAADSCADQDNLLVYVDKIHCGRLASGEEFVMAGAGATSSIKSLLLWIKTLHADAISMTKWPEQSEHNDPACLLIVPGVGAYRKSGAFFEPLHGAYAIGSGRDFALAAMRLGKTAAEAVELACQFDIYSRPPVATTVAVV